jgi:hypothetical protein
MMGCGQQQTTCNFERVAVVESIVCPLITTLYQQQQDMEIVMTTVRRQIYHL